jgi:hypothetical protein
MFSITKACISVFFLLEVRSDQFNEMSTSQSSGTDQRQAVLRLQKASFRSLWCACFHTYVRGFVKASSRTNAIAHSYHPLGRTPLGPALDVLESRSRTAAVDPCSTRHRALSMHVHDDFGLTCCKVRPKTSSGRLYKTPSYRLDVPTSTNSLVP